MANARVALSTAVKKVAMNGKTMRCPVRGGRLDGRRTAAIFDTPAGLV
jgi:hypothetical protein